MVWTWGPCWWKWRININVWYIYWETRCSKGCSTNTFVSRYFIHRFCNSSFVEISSKHLHSKTIRDKQLKFWGKVHLPLHVMCHVSWVMCLLSRVTCHMFFSFSFLLTKYWSYLVEGLLSTWPTASSFCLNTQARHTHCYAFQKILNLVFSFYDCVLRLNILTVLKMTDWVDGRWASQPI